MLDYNGGVDTCQSPLDVVLSRLKGVRRAGNGWSALCPAHDDKRQSLSVAEGRDGRVLLKCHAGCDAQAIVRAIGLELRDLFPPKSERKREQAPTRVFEIRDVDGKLVALHERYDKPDGKSFVWKLPNGQTGLGGLSTKALPLYGSERLRQWPDDALVVLCEGEKAAQALLDVGIPALGTVCGASTVPDISVLKPLAGRRVVLWPDNDDAGRAHMSKIAVLLLELGADVKWFDWPEAPSGGDAADYIARNGDVRKLQELLASAPEWKPLAEISIDEEFTDRNNALILAQKMRGTVLWVPAWGWLLWTGAHWERDPDGSRVLALARELLPKHYLERALHASDYKERERLCEHAKRAHKRHNISNALELAKGDLRAEPKEFDEDPWLLNCSNGVLDLRTGELRPHSPELRLTKFCPVAYDPNAQAPTWERFLREIFLDDDELIRYVQRACGYSISGDVREDKLFICWGTGANGKSTFLQTLRRVLGDYAGAIAPAAIVHKGKDAHPTAVADLYGLRFAIAVETEEDQRLAEAQVKALTGRDSIKARFMHKDYFEFEPRAKIWLATNHRPLIRDTSPAIWRRIALIPFRAFFPPELQDKTLGEKLWQEREGILAWLVQGCLAWQEQGLGECSAVAEATEDYRSEMDALQEWLQERCVPDAKAITLFKDLYDDYCAWCGETGQDPLGKRAFANRLTEKGFEPVKKAGRVGARKGLRLREK
jgi:putative DNA primase/helicase